MTGLPLIFGAPYVLLALIMLPAIWLLLRATPPAPRRIAFPPLRIFADIAARREQPARTPWWLLLLRLAIAALLILACSGPLWNPPQALPGKGPVLVLADNGFPAARDWTSRARALGEMAQQSFRADRPFAFAPLAEAPAAIETATPEATREALNGLRPAPHLAERAAHLPGIEAFLTTHPDASLIWLSDGTGGADDEAFLAGLKRLGPNLTIIREDHPDLIAATAAPVDGLKLSIRLLRPLASGRGEGILRALDNRGQIVAETPFRFNPDATGSEAVFDIPTEIRNNVSRVEIAGEKTAGAVVLMDERNRRRTVGIASGTTLDQAQPLLAPTYYLQRALQPHADIREGRGGGADAVGALVDQRVDALILADTGSLDPETTRKLAFYVEEGGLLIRFAGSRLASGDDTLLPVRLRRGDRELGSVLSWSQPKKLMAFPRTSPFFGLGIAEDIVVNRQVLAEPAADLDEHSWATLEDGTPLVTAHKRGKGMIVLFHVTATPSWSNLPLSGLFVDMLRRAIQFGRVSATGAQASGSEPLAPRLVLDGHGDFTAPAPTATAIPASYSGRASVRVAPGFYGPPDGGIAVNALTATDTLRPLDDALPGATYRAPGRAEALDLRGPLFLTALMLFLIDTLLTLLIGGALPRWRRRAAAVLAAAFLALPSGGEAMAQADQVETAALETRIAYVTTGNAEVDDIARAGLTGLGQYLRINTSFEPAEPAGIDPEKDELAFYPLIYWPIAPAQPFPSDRALRNLNAFMRNGGTILFDTRDALRARPGMPETPETAYLRRLLASLDVPQLEPVPGDHVLTKTFFLLDSFPGRYDSSPLWTEISTPREPDDDTGPVRVGDGVSPVLVTGNDFAAAWAIGPRNESLYPVTGADPRQREMAFRSGVNIVLYTLTGNYKSDQVHVEDLLQRLGRQGAR